MDNIAIKAVGVSKTIGSQEILSGVSFEITSGSLVALIGPNGAGKSTLIKVLLGIDTAYQGEIMIDDPKDIQYIPQQQSHDRFQLPISVREFLRVGAHDSFKKIRVSDQELVEALDHVGVSGEKLNQSITGLSGGERQRVAIARALISEPTLLVLDEPLAAVDYGSRKGLYDLIRHLQQDHNMTVLLVSHDIDSVLPIADEVLCLNKRIMADCHPRDTTATELRSTIHHHC